MGQYWKLFNLDKCQFANLAGSKFGEFFAYNGNEDYIVNILLNDQWQPEQDVWAGDRVILLGDYARSLPPNTVTDEDSDLLKECTASDLLEWNDQVHIYDELLECSDRRKFVNEATSDLPGDTVYALRSLNKKEYIRRDIVRGYRRYHKGGTPGLGQALYTVVRWSDAGAAHKYNSTNYVPESGGTTIPLHRGAWAGNRIDVVALTDEIQQKLDEDGWTDISEETARHVSDVYAGDGF